MSEPVIVTAAAEFAFLHSYMHTMNTDTTQQVYNGHQDHMQK